jgi:hypothetical protein
MYEDNELVRLWLPGDKTAGRNATHVQVNGMSGAGKSAFFKQSATEILTRRDVVLIVLDPSKGDQTVRFLHGSPAHVVTDMARCKKLLKKLPQAITEQASQLGKWGFDEWVPEAFTGHGMPYVVIWVEEATKLLQSVDKFDTIAQEARSAGISLVLSQQKSTFRQMSTDVRSQLGAAICFGVKEPEDAGYSLSDVTLEAGASPWRWGNRMPGSLYLEAPGVPEERFATPARTYRSSDSALTASIAEHAEQAPALWVPTAEILGLPQHATASDEQEGGSVVPLHTPMPSGDSDEERLDAFEENLEDFDDDPDDAEAGLTPLPGEVETDLDEEIDPDAEIPELTGDSADIDLPQPRPSTAQARANVRAWALAQTGVYRPADVPTELHGRHRSWVVRVLQALAEDGVIDRADDPGTYTRPAHGHAA